MSAAPPVLSVRDLSVRFATRRGGVDAVRGVSFDVAAGPQPRAGRRVGLGQEPDLLRDHGPDAGQRDGRRVGALDGEELVGATRARGSTACAAAAWAWCSRTR